MAEKGTHEELMSKKGLYFDLVQSQMAGKDEKMGEDADSTDDLPDKNNSAFQRQLSRQITRQSTTRISSAESDGGEIKTSRFQLLTRLMKLSVPELPYIIIGIPAFPWAETQLVGTISFSKCRLPCFHRVWSWHSPVCNFVWKCHGLFHNYRP